MLHKKVPFLSCRWEKTEVYGKRRLTFFMCCGMLNMLGRFFWRTAWFLFWEVFLNFMKLLNLQHHVGEKMDLERSSICILRMSGHVSFAFGASDNIRSHPELWLSSQSISSHFHMRYSPCYNVISMLVSLFLWTVLEEVIFLPQMSGNYSMP